MRISESDVKAILQSIEVGFKNNPSAQPELDFPSERSKCSFGAVWHGDFYTKTEKGHFGSPAKPLHYGMINDRRKKVVRKPTRSFALMSTRKHGGSCVMQLPAGVLKTRQQKKSYINLNYRVLVRRAVLEKSFDFIQFLPEQYINEAKRIMKNGR